MRRRHSTLDQREDVAAQDSGTLHVGQVVEPAQEDDATRHTLGSGQLGSRPGDPVRHTPHRSSEQRGELLGVLRAHEQVVRGYGRGRPLDPPDAVAPSQGHQRAACRGALLGTVVPEHRVGVHLLQDDGCTDGGRQGEDPEAVQEDGVGLLGQVADDRARTRTGAGRDRRNPSHPAQCRRRLENQRSDAPTARRHLLIGRGHTVGEVREVEIDPAGESAQHVGGDEGRAVGMRPGLSRRSIAHREHPHVTNLAHRPKGGYVCTLTC